MVDATHIMDLEPKAGLISKLECCKTIFLRLNIIKHNKYSRKIDQIKCDLSGVKIISCLKHFQIEISN